MSEQLTHDVDALLEQLNDARDALQKDLGVFNGLMEADASGRAFDGMSAAIRQAHVNLGVAIHRYTDASTDYDAAVCALAP